jgi:hypothetical protein
LNPSLDKMAKIKERSITAAETSLGTAINISNEPRGVSDGLKLGTSVGSSDGDVLGEADRVGALVGSILGSTDGSSVGEAVGYSKITLEDGSTFDA